MLECQVRISSEGRRSGKGDDGEEIGRGESREREIGRGWLMVMVVEYKMMEMKQSRDSRRDRNRIVSLSPYLFPFLPRFRQRTVERLLVRNVINKQDTHSTSVVGSRDRSESFLA